MPAFDRGGVAVLRGVVGGELLADWRAQVDRRYDRAAQCAGGDPALNPHSASLRLTAVGGLDVVAVLHALLQGELRGLCRQRLGERIACNLDQCWVRRQYAPAAAPPRHAPHGWHQDGALHADFAAPAWPETLSMLTCWVALTPCGVDAPGLQWVAERLPRLLAPAALAEARVAERFPAAVCRQPPLAAGDALLFGGGSLHRTHVTPSMTAPRSSLELRLFAADRLPARLSGDRFVDAL